MSEVNRVTFFGTYKKNGRVSMAASAVAVLFASQTFINPNGKYEVFMCFLALVSSVWVSLVAYKSKAIFGVFAIPLALLWLNPLLGGDWFNSISLIFFFAHALFALLMAGYAFTFMKLSTKTSGEK